MARHFTKISSVRRYLSDLLNRFEAGEIGEGHLKAATYTSNILANVIRDSDIEQRLTSLETQIKNNDKKLK